jgi:hypothetical protein
MSQRTLCSPLTQEIFFHIYITQASLPRAESLGTKETVKWLLHQELVETIGLETAQILGHNLQLTEKGHVWKDAILSVPLPIKQWVVPTT